MLTFFKISLAAILIENFVFVKFYGICPFLGVSQKVETAVGMGLAVTFTMTISSALTNLLYRYVLANSFLDLRYLETIAFILLVACLVQFIEMFLQKMIPSLYSSLGIYLPLITTNCAVLGVALVNVQKNYGFLEATLNGFMGGVGFLMAIFLLALVRERFVYAKIPKPFQGFPIALIAGGLLALAFSGFQGIAL